MITLCVLSYVMVCVHIGSIGVFAKTLLRGWLMSEKTKYLCIVNILFAVYSLTGVFGKFAACEDGITLRFVLLYGASLCLMVVYAIVWQQVIKKLPLMVAYANKAVVMLWSLVWGVLFFNEVLTVGKLVGIAMVMLGVVLFATSDEEIVE